MLLGGGEVDGVRVLSEDSVRAMRTDQLTEAQKRSPFLGMPYWQGRGFGLNLSVVTDPAQSTPLFGPGGVGTFTWPGAFGTAIRTVRYARQQVTLLLQPSCDR